MTGEWGGTRFAIPFMLLQVSSLRVSVTDSVDLIYRSKHKINNLGIVSGSKSSLFR